jgi:hypothetical protein
MSIKGAAAIYHFVLYIYKHMHTYIYIYIYIYMHACVVVVVLLTNDLADPINRTDCLFSSRFATDFANRVDLVDSMLFVVSSFVLRSTIGSSLNLFYYFCCDNIQYNFLLFVVLVVPIVYTTTDCTVVRLLFVSAACLFAFVCLAN